MISMCLKKRSTRNFIELRLEHCWFVWVTEQISRLCLQTLYAHMDGALALPAYHYNFLGLTRLRASFNNQLITYQVTC